MGFAVAGLAVILLMVSSAEAVSKGPGGRIYTTGRNSAGNAIVLASFTIDENWDNLTAYYTQHGDIRDVVPSSSRKRYAGSSPELETFAGAGYGTIVVGAAYDNAPGAKLASPAETMDVLRVTPSDGSHSVEVLGSGRAYPGGSTWTYREYKCTEDGQLAIPDPAAGFTGDPEAVVVEGDLYNGNLWIVKDSFGDGDMTDNVEDYSADPTHIYYNTIGYEEDFEILGNRMYSVSSYSYKDAGTNGIFYYRKEADNSITRNHFYYDRNSEWAENLRTGGPVEVSGTGLAVGEIQGHQAAWTIAYDRTAGQWGTNYLGFFIDLNNDGDAMDNAQVTGSVDEYRLNIYSAASTSNDWDDPSVGWNDLELITNENGTMFLLVQDSNNAWARGRAMFVLELADNGEYIGGNDGVKLIFRERTPYPGSVPTGWLMPGTNHWETEFDPVVAAEIPGDANGDGKVDGGDLAIWQQNYDPLGTAQNTFAMGDWNGDGKIDGGDLALWQQNYDPLGTGGLDGLGSSVPEPATLLLLGTGLAGGIGFIRRRMK
jgi:hypothetical protein